MCGISDPSLENMDGVPIAKLLSVMMNLSFFAFSLASIFGAVWYAIKEEANT